MKAELSILIPTYNYNVYPLAGKLHEQLVKLKIHFEIVVYDDHSPKPSSENEKINMLSHSRYIKLEKNIGRSAIRNKLAREANFNTLLFLDADTMVIEEDFIKNYMEVVTMDSHIIYGGIRYINESPPPDQILRWKYGKEREALPVSERKELPHLRFLTLNFLIKKSVFNTVKFNEDIPNLRHEDTLFALNCKKEKIKVHHINNPVFHLGLETSEVFLKKSKESVDALYLFIKKDLINTNQTALSKKADSLKKQGIAFVIIWVYNFFGKMMEKNLLSRSPSLFIFDLYRLGYYLKISKKQ